MISCNDTIPATSSSGPFNPNKDLYLQVVWLYPALLTIFFFLEPFSLLHATPTSYRIEHISTEEGLPHSIVYTLLPDSKGFLWAGTRDGLVKYDGYSFTTYWNGIAPITVLAEDHNRDIWVGTARGLHRFNRKNATFTTYRHNPSNPFSVSNDLIHTLMVDKRGRIWIGTESGIDEFLPESNTFHRYLGNLSFKVSTMVEDKQGNLWAAGVTGKGSIGRDEPVSLIYSMPTSDTTFRSVPHSADYLNRSASPLIFLNDSVDEIRCFLARKKKGIVLQYDREKGELKERSSYQFRLQPHVGPFQFAGDHHYWLSIYEPSSPESGLYKVDITSVGDSSQRALNSSDGDMVIRGKINDLKQDHSGFLWACSDAGIYKIVPQRYFFPPAFVFATPPDRSDSKSRVRSIYRDADGYLWVSTDHQLLKVDEDRNEVEDLSSLVSVGNNLFMGVVNTIFGDGEEILFATRNNLVRYNISDNRFIHSTDSISNAGIWAIVKESTDRLWVGTNRSFVGLYGSDNRPLGLLDGYREGSFLNKAVWVLLKDSKGRMWAGAELGLYRWDRPTSSARFYHHNPDNPHSLPPGSVWALHEDSEGTLWVGIYGGGLARYDPEMDQFKTISTKDGLGSNGVCAILEDNSGNLWVSTSAGLTRYNPTTDSLRTYTAADGLPVNEFALKAAWKDEDGRLYFGGTNTIVRFYPDSLQRNYHIPQIVVTAFRINDSTIATELHGGDSIQLYHQQNDLEVEFSALDFLNPSGNIYKYKLSGVDEGWVFAGRRRFARYANLAPGKYELSIRGANSHGVWNEKGIIIYITIVPPFWGTMWFHGLVTGLLLLTGYLAVRQVRRRYRERHERRVLEAELQALRLQMKPHFIFNTLHSIQSFILNHQVDEANTYLTKFANLMRRALHLSEQSLISLREEGEFLSLYLELEAFRTGNTFDYQLMLPAEKHLEQITIPPILVQPFVENAIHHGLRNKKGGHLIVQFKLSDENELHCLVEDNGIGREAAKRLKEGSVHKSMGMGVTKRRIDLLNAIHQYQATISVIDLYNKEKEPEGTRVLIRIPVH